MRRRWTISCFLFTLPVLEPSHCFPDTREPFSLSSPAWELSFLLLSHLQPFSFLRALYLELIPTFTLTCCKEIEVDYNSSLPHFNHTYFLQLTLNALTPVEKSAGTSCRFHTSRRGRNFEERTFLLPSLSYPSRPAQFMNSTVCPDFLTALAVLGIEILNMEEKKLFHLGRTVHEFL